MRRLVLLILGILFITVSAYLYLTALPLSRVNIIVNDQKLQTPAIMEENTVLIPAIPVLETLGFKTTRKNQERLLAIIGNYSAVFTAHSNEVNINDETVTFNASLVIEDDELYLPALKAAEAVGALAYWDGDSRILYINTPQVFDPEPAEDQEEPLLHLAYPPRDGFYYYSSDLFVFGTTRSFSDVKVTVNGEPVDIIDHRTGNFLTMTEIPRGEKYLLTIEAQNAKGTTRVERSVHYPDWWQAMPEQSPAIHQSRQLPAANQVIQAGDTLHVAVQGSPGADATFQLGNRDAVYSMMERAYPGGPAGKGGIYTATYRVSEDELPDSGETTLIPITVTLQKDNSLVSQEMPGKIAFTADQIYRFLEVKPEHELKNQGWLYLLRDNELNILSSTFGGSGHPTTVIHYLHEGSRYKAIGRSGSYYRIAIPGSSNTYLIHQRVVKELSRSEMAEPILSKVELTEGREKASLILETTERFPFFVNDSDTGLEIELRGVKTDKSLLIPPKPVGVSDMKVESLAPDNDNNQLVTIGFEWSMTGFKPYWDGNSLIIDFYKPPMVNPEEPFSGKKIIIDPGHGGEDTGAIGPGPLHEKDVNLAMSSYLKDMLEEAGAEVFMTRTEDIYVNLYDRPEKIDSYNPDLLISVHANAHRHGAQAVDTHGLMTLYNYEHNKILAEIMLDKLEEHMGLPAIRTWKRNIAVVRHTHVPTVLVEAGYMMHPIDNWHILHPGGQKEFARAMKEGIKEYFLFFDENNNNVR